MKISANQLNAHLKKSLFPCYLVTGDEPLLVQEALDQIRAAARAQGFGSRELFIATTGFDWTDLRNASGNLSLFAEKRVFELLDDGPRRHHAALVNDRLDNLREYSEQIEIPQNGVANAQALHFHGDLIPVERHRAVHLRDGCARDGKLVELAEELIDGATEAVFYRTPRILTRHGWTVVLQSA